MTKPVARKFKRSRRGQVRVTLKLNKLGQALLARSSTLPLQTRAAGAGASGLDAERALPDAAAPAVKRGRGVTQMLDASPTSYDDVPYESYPLWVTHPDHLAVVATLAGMRPAPGRALPRARARVRERRQPPSDGRRAARGALRRRRPVPGADRGGQRDHRRRSASRTPRSRRAASPTSTKRSAASTTSSATASTPGCRRPCRRRSSPPARVTWPRRGSRT